MPVSGVKNRESEDSMAELYAEGKEDRRRGPPRVLIVGASTRAAAHAAIRAGYMPICADSFADADLRACAETVPVYDYPQGLVEAASIRVKSSKVVSADKLADTARIPRKFESPWMYTGAVENHPDIVAAIQQDESAGRRALWGNPPEVLRRVRDPAYLASILDSASIPALAVRPATSPPLEGAWLIKPLASGGGRGIEIWNGSDSHTRAEPHYFQQYRPGLPLTGLFLACKDGTHCLGVSRQLVGLPMVNASQFGYCGSIAPWSLPPELAQQVVKIGELIGSVFMLRGLFGVDFVQDEAGLWVTEVNPRYTASAEVVELWLRYPLMQWHRLACEGFLNGKPFVPRLPTNDPAHVPTTDCIGKIVLFAAQESLCFDATRWIHVPNDFRMPEVADIPLPGMRIARGQPVCTLFAQGASPPECTQALLEKAAWFQRDYLRILEPALLESLAGKR